MLPTKTPRLMIALALAAACTPQGAAAPAEADANPAAATASGSGEVAALDPAAGTVTINHGPIEALEWPAMTMTFAAPDVDLGAIKQGDTVRFERGHTRAMQR